MENNNNKNNSKDEKNKIKEILSQIRLTRKNFGWWIFGVFVAILFVGFVRTWFNPEAHYFDPILGIINLILLPFGHTIDSLDFRMEDILYGLASGAQLTFIVSMVSLIVGFFFALILAVILVNKSHLYGLKLIAQSYVDFFRSTPLLVQVLLVYYGFAESMGDVIRSLNIPMFSYEVFAGILALALNTAAYQAEIIRGGILAIPTGQTEAARALGLTSGQTMRYVILPQAIRIIVPPLTNELINVLLNSSLISAIGVRDLTKKSQSLQARFSLWEVFLISAVFYFVIAFSLSKITKRLEVKLRIPGLGVVND